MKVPYLEQPPLQIGAAAWYKDTAKLRKQFTMKDSFGEPVQLFAEDSSHAGRIMVPRNCAPVTGTTCSVFSHPTTYQWEDGFVPREARQLEMVEESVDLFNWSYGGHIMQAPTGYGKTYLGSAVIQRMGVRTCILTTKDDLVQDWIEALSSVLKIPRESIGVWRGDKEPDALHEVVVGLVQSVCKGPERYSKKAYSNFGLVLIDEVQRMGADKFSQAMWHFPARHRLGLSATPYRKDGREAVFHAHIGQVEVVTEEMSLVPKVICVDTGWQVPELWQYDPGEQKSVYGPLHIPWGRAIVATKHLQADTNRNAIICSFMRTALKRGRMTVILSDTVDHLRIIKEALIESGVPDEEGMFGWYCGLQSGVYGKQKDGYPPAREQREKAKLARIALATFKMTGEGTNVPWWDTEILATPKADVVQPVGRILREWEGACEPVVLDLCDYNHIVTATFAGSRRKWYTEIGAEIIDR